MRPLGMPPIPSARSRARLPVAMTVGGGWVSGLKATPGPKRRSTSPKASQSSWAIPGGGASRTVAVVIVGGQLLPGTRGQISSLRLGGPGRRAGCSCLARGVFDLEAAAPTRAGVRASPPSCGCARPDALAWRRAGQAGSAVGAEAGDQHRAPRGADLGGVGGAVVAAAARQEVRQLERHRGRRRLGAVAPGAATG